jgi:hypothetical protein
MPQLYRAPAVFAPPVKKWGGGGRGEAAAMAEVLRCASCNVDSSGEMSFIEHINGRAHTGKAR